MNFGWKFAPIYSAEYQDSSASSDLRDAGDAFSEHGETISRRLRSLQVSEFEEVNSAFIEEPTIIAKGDNSNNLLRAEPVRDLFGRTLSIVMVDSKGVPLTQRVSSMATALNNSLKADVELDNNSNSVITLGVKSDARSVSSTDGADNIVFGGPTSEESLDSCVDVAVMGTRNAAPRDARTAGVVIVGDVFRCRGTILPKRSFLTSRDFVAALQEGVESPPRGAYCWDSFFICETMS